MTAPTSRPSADPREALYDSDSIETLACFVEGALIAAEANEARVALAPSTVRRILAALRDRAPDHPDPGSRAMPGREEIANAIWDHVDITEHSPCCSMLCGVDEAVNAILALFPAPQKPELVRPTEPGVSDGLVERLRAERCDHSSACDKLFDQAADHIASLNATIAELKARLVGAKLEPMFPIMGGPKIPWSLIAPCEAQAQRNHSQSLKRLAERGGLDMGEAVAVMSGKSYREIQQPDTESFLDFIAERKARAVRRATASILDTETGHGR